MESVKIWTYRNQPFTSANIGDHFGFVYILTDRQNGMRYVGQKQFFSTRTLPPLKGQTRKRKKTLESDWSSYCSSSPVIQRLVAEHGLERFDRTIVHLCRSKSEMAYLEARIQFVGDVLLSPDWYNDMIMVRVSGKHIKGLRHAQNTHDSKSDEFSGLWLTQH